MMRVLCLLLSLAVIPLLGMSSLIPPENQLPCPDATVRSNYVINNFDLNRFKGTYYELAYKDVTQPRFCDCIRTTKNPYSANQFRDYFIIRCSGQYYPADLIYNFTSTRGYFYGDWANLPVVNAEVVFSDYIVDVGFPDSGDDGVSQYRWVLEFQCQPRNNNAGNYYFAFNYYAQANDDTEAIAQMDAAARAHGLAKFLDLGNPLKIVNQTNCNYPAPQ
eukprot:TRINITY_DN15431_c0_g1_i1.p1 TRINITY_DN15431_c0_g1~~TRINITY_DN15431_c0_g1_i1.p1  ORF type:complete len:219 (-),score=51.20 TRINITY_DN15431_c0_g1_i1:138-794(-)